MADEADVERIALTRITKLAPGVFYMSNPGADALIAERYADKLAEGADQFFRDAVLGEPYDPPPPINPALIPGDLS